MAERDIAERLRTDADAWMSATHTITGPRIHELEREAADEIDRLRTALCRIVSLGEKNVPKYAQEIASEALKGAK